MTGWPGSSAARWIPGLLCGALAGFALWGRLAVLFADPLPVGIDGYWYAVQARGVLEDGWPPIPALPVVHYLAGALAAAVGPVAAVKLVAAAGSAAHVVAAWLLARELGGDRWAALVAPAVVATSPAAAYLPAEHVQQALGLAGACLYLWLLARPARRRLPLVVAFAACVLTHKLAAALALAATLVAYADRRFGRARWAPPAAWLALPAAAAAYGLARWLGRPRGLFSAELDLSLVPVSFGGGVANAFGHEVWLAAAAAVACLLLARRAGRPLPAAALVPLVFALALALPVLHTRDVEGLAPRLRLAAFFALAPCAALAVALLPLRPRGRAAVAVVAAAVLVVARSPEPGEGVVRIHAELAAAVAEVGAVAPPDAVFVTPRRALAFMTTWYARRPARTSWHAGMDPARTWRLLPEGDLAPELAAAIARAGDADRPRRVRAGSPYALLLVPEPSYRRLLAAAGMSDEATVGAPAAPF